MNLRNQIIRPELVWTGSRFERDLSIFVNADGQIGQVSAARSQATADAVDMRRRALLPGFVNAHSHAFQIGLRAQQQRFDSGTGNFWSWRETMYRLVDSLDADRIFDLSRQAFREMLRAGITSVGEFHYLHHPEPHTTVAESARWAFDTAIIAAAREAGIRLVFIQTYYATGNVGHPLEGAQRRFGPISRDAFVQQLEQLAGTLDGKSQSLALACHSVRAVSIEDLQFFRDMAHSNHWPFHIHVEEVRKEIDDCRNALGKGPMRVLLDELRIDERVTAIHCTHATQDDLTEWIARGASICLCPITEGNLSDGFGDVPHMVARGANLCFGTDCNIRLAVPEEMRMLEFGQRLRNEQRGIVVDTSGECGPSLLRLATVNGAHSLGLACGAIEAGRCADFLAINLDHLHLRDTSDDALCDAFIFGCGSEVIDGVWVGGEYISGGS
ncbi:MAG TPA: formimidoylglutamate deiminase [Tepidisphaeraceae bacterium]|nr:formimidoylglutamate deiminase [Tepidisphaeraceae bacterium]